MNIQKIREMKEGLKKYREYFRQFRIWENTSYFSYTKERESALWEAEQDFEGDEPFEETSAYSRFRSWWDYIWVNRAAELYRHLGWEKDDILEKSIPWHDSEYESLNHCVEFSKIHDKMQTIEDEIEYAYAVFLLSNTVKETGELYSAYSRKIFAGIKEYGLGMMWDWDETRKVFVAMWFDNTMNKAREEIKYAVNLCGYQPVILDEKNYNGQIVPEIYREIEESAFVIADLTGGRGGVYYEAGYAMAKGKQIILSCKQADQDKVHFDVAQYNTIFWEDEKDLHDRLVNRIETT